MKQFFSNCRSGYYDFGRYGKSSSLCSTVAILFPTVPVYSAGKKVGNCLIQLINYFPSRTQNDRQVTYQHRPANSPPQYHEAPWPEKPPGYAEALSPAHASPIYTASAVVQQAEMVPAQLEAGNGQQQPPANSEDMTLTQIDLNETPVMEDAVSIVPSEVTVASLSVTNPFKDEVERKV